MTRIILILLLCSVILTGCLSSTVENGEVDSDIYESVETHRILELLCDSDTNCIQQQCPDLKTCPLTIALSHPVIFDFISKYASCEGCNTPTFSPDQGIGKCVEYTVQPQDKDHEVSFWVSTNCNFRYAQPEEMRIYVLVQTENGTIQRITPHVKYIQNPTSCQQNSDCRCLSGSGVELIGCSNFFHAPLHFAGYYEGEACGCVEGNCVRMDQVLP